MSGGIDVWGVLPCVKKFNVVVWSCGFDGVGDCLYICYVFEYFL